MFFNQTNQCFTSVIFSVALTLPALADVADANVGSSSNQNPTRSSKNDLQVKDIDAALITSTKRDTVINSSFGQVTTKSGSIVYVLDNGRELAVYNLHSDADSVKVILSDSTPVNVPEGKELLLTRSSSGTFATIHPRTPIIYRHPAEINVGGGIRAFIAEFSIPAAIAVIPELRAKLKSTDLEEQKFIGGVLRNAIQKEALTRRTRPGPVSSATGALNKTGATIPNNYQENLVLYEEKERVIHTNNGDLICAPDSVVFLCQSTKSLAIFVLDQKKKGDVKVVIGGKSVPVMSAQELIVTPLLQSKFRDVNPKTGILFRAPRREENVSEGPSTELNS